MNKLSINKFLNLEKLLAAGNWKAANKETEKLMLEIGTGGEYSELTIFHIDNFPCAELQNIDKLWLKYSDGNFGFSVQKEIYQSLGGKREYNSEIWVEFAHRVGWSEQKNLYSFLYLEATIFEITAPKGHLPVIMYIIESENEYGYNWDLGLIDRADCDDPAKFAIQQFFQVAYISSRLMECQQVFNSQPS